MDRQSIDKKRIARYFLKSSASYDHHAEIQAVIADNLLQKLVLHGPGKYERVLEVGCCTGLLTRQLINRFDINVLFLNDLVAEFEPVVVSRLDRSKVGQVVPFFGDIECMNIPDNLDLCISSSTIQWLAEPITFFKQLAEKIRSGGMLGVSFFIEGTLKEIKALTQVGLNYMDAKLLRQVLEGHYDILGFETNRQQLYFASSRDVLHHVKNTGVGGVTPYRWTKKSLMEFEEQYCKNFATDQGYPVSYNNVTVVARKR